MLFVSEASAKLFDISEKMSQKQVISYESKRKTWLQIVKFSASPICVFFFFFSKFFHFFTVFPFIVCSFFHVIFFPSSLYITLYLHCFDIFCCYTSFGEKKKVKRKIHKKTQIHEKKEKNTKKKTKIGLMEI